MLESEFNQQFTRRQPSLQILVDLLNILRLVDFVDIHLQLPAAQVLEQHARVRLQFVTGDEVLHDGGAHDFGVFGREAGDREWGDGAGGVAEEDHAAFATDGIERAFPGCGADRVVAAANIRSISDGLLGGGVASRVWVKEVNFRLTRNERPRAQSA